MSLQEIFYIVAIITMGIHILVLIVITAVLFAIKKKVTKTAESVEKRAEIVKDYIVHPNIIITTVGKALLNRAMTQIAKVIRR